MSRRGLRPFVGAALVSLISTLAFSASAGAERTSSGFDPLQRDAVVTAPVRDAVLERISPRVATAVARDDGLRYPSGDASARTVLVKVSALCEVLCVSPDPAGIALLLGAIPHGEELTSLTVDMVSSGLGSEITTRCGPTALACYYPTQQLMIVAGSDSPPSNGNPSRNFVVVHEYGHHLANNRLNPPFSPTIDFGPKRWATYERVCQGVRGGVLHPGDQDAHYYENPGEAFAEAFAFSVYPAEVAWGWIDSLKPDAGAFDALRADALSPWKGRTKVERSGRIARNGKFAKKLLATPLDGIVNLTLTGTASAGLNLVLRDTTGKQLARSTQPGSTEHITYTVCGTSGLRAIIKRKNPGRANFTLSYLRP